jgi:hypothetical protein
LDVQVQGLHVHGCIPAVVVLNIGENGRKKKGTKFEKNSQSPRSRESVMIGCSRVKWMSGKEMKPQEREEVMPAHNHLTRKRYCACVRETLFFPVGFCSLRSHFLFFVIANCQVAEIVAPKSTK